MKKFSLYSSASNESSNTQFLVADSLLQLKPYDLIWIRPDPYFSNQKQVTIKRGSLYPGRYAMIIRHY